MKEFWNARYAKKEFAYGQEPNVFFKQELNKLKAGKILLPADGEGRNSIYAAKNNWDSFACDISNEGKIKALDYAKSLKLTLDYKVGDFGALQYENNSFDCIALIYAHFPPNKKKELHQLVNNYLQIGGTIIFEAFSKKHLEYNTTNPKAGGPKNKEMLFSEEELQSYFPNYKIEYLKEVVIELAEGDFHIGKSSVIRFVAKKMEMNSERLF